MGGNATFDLPGKIGSPPADARVVATQPGKQRIHGYRRARGLRHQCIDGLKALDLVIPRIKHCLLGLPAQNPQYASQRADQCQLATLGLALEFKAGVERLRRLTLNLQAEAPCPKSVLWIIDGFSPGNTGTPCYQKNSTKGSGKKQAMQAAIERQSASRFTVLPADA